MLATPMCMYLVNGFSIHHAKHIGPASQVLACTRLQQQAMPSHASRSNAASVLPPFLLKPVWQVLRLLCGIANVVCRRQLL